MSFTTYASLLYGKKAVYLYEMVVGGSTYRYALAPTDYEYGGNTYTAEAVLHAKLRQTGKIEREEFLITMPQTNEAAAAVREGLGVLNTSLTVRKGYSDDPDQEFVLKFKGRIIAAKPLLGTTVLVCETAATKFRRPILSAVIQRPCRHALYHTGCGVTLADFQTSVVATAWTTPVLTIEEESYFEDGYYDGGIVTYNGSSQMIMTQRGGQFRLIGAIPGLATVLTTVGSAQVTIAPGCDLSRATCNSKFNNIRRYGGFSWIDESPFDGRNLF